ncbi:MAG: glutamate synthase central domain-containing protein, partial [Desulfobacterales bacterium]|nr:glutamate synthase central domain-containing protein [Desulfobacterales bacterium]
MKRISRSHTICLPPQGRGLYNPQLEHDACGVGMICDIQGGASHDIVRTALQMAVNLTHRGACGCDATTGDGAGILMQLPDGFLRRVGGELGFDLPETGAYGTGLVFLPSDNEQRRRCQETIEAATKDQGQTLIGWRTVPVNREAIGGLALAVEPAVRQVFVGRGPGLPDRRAFERKLYIVRKLAERAVRESNLPQKGYFHIPSLSARTMVYKGMFVADQLGPYFPDLAAPDMASALAIVHQRYSTNTFPAWDLAQPFRFLCHNGEINTLRGNINWMNARQALFASDLFGADMAKLFPIATPGASDSAILDNALELLYHTGRSLPHAMMMLIPEAWQEHRTMSQAKKDFYAYHACLMEPWDGPASIPFTDGVRVGAVLDRNGLRPSRYTVTRDGRVIMASETGVVPIAPENIAHKGRLQPGRMFLVDTAEGRIVEDEEIKASVAAQQPYGQWLGAHLVAVAGESATADAPAFDPERLFALQQVFGYTAEDFKIILDPMARSGVEPTGSMGDDTPPAILSKRAQLLYDYFKQLFAQVTNPPLDAIREKLVTSLTTTIGAERDLFAETPAHARQLRLNHPILTTAAYDWLRRDAPPDFRPALLPMRFARDAGGAGLAAGLGDLCRRAADAVREGAAVLILSDRSVNRAFAPIPALLATAAVH